MAKRKSTKLLVHPKFTMQKLNYIHNNPVFDGIVRRAEDYRYSSAGNYAEYEDILVEVELLDFGIQEGYVFN